MKNTILRGVAGLLIFSIFFFASREGIAVSAQRDADTRLWEITPPAPQISESERLAELAARRREVSRRVGQHGVLILFSAEPRVYTNNIDYHYRQENNLYYLTGIKQEGTTLVIVPGAKQKREILFVSKRNPWQEMINGRMMSFEEARERSGITTVLDAALLDDFLAFLAPRAASTIAQRSAIAPPAEKFTEDWREDFSAVIEAIRANRGELYLLLPSERDSREFRQEQQFASKLSSIATGLVLRSAMPIFADMRLRKSLWEIRLLQHAIDITSEAFHRIFAIAAPDLYEYEIQAEFEYTFRRRKADNWAYPPIIGSSTNATIPHYITNRDRLNENDLLLMDCGAEYDHYTADVTRTIPISGKFTKEQGDIYRIVYEAQQEAIKMVRPGNTYDPKGARSVNARAAEVVKDGLLRLGLITSKENEEYRIWSIHGTSHWLGMNVHDVGNVDGNIPTFAPGMVLTVEPGIYIRPSALDMLPQSPENERFIKAVRPAFERYKGIGVRIEDDVLVTEGEPKVLSAAIPSKLEDVEATIARLKQELRRSRFPSMANH